ncbi:MAG: FGGY family carbohydrate kinase [Eisenbergiella massiliensis]
MLFFTEPLNRIPKRLWKKIYSLLEEAENSGYGPDCVSAVGISSQMHGILYVDGEGRAVSPFYTWKDEKGKQLMADGETYEAYLSKRTGMPLFSGYGTVTHFFLSRNGMIPGGSSCNCQYRRLCCHASDRKETAAYRRVNCGKLRRFLSERGLL